MGYTLNDLKYLTAQGVVLQSQIYEGTTYDFICTSLVGAGAITDSVWHIVRIAQDGSTIMHVDGVYEFNKSVDDLGTVQGYTYTFG